MIRTFSDKQTENLFYERAAKIDSKICGRAMDKLALLDSCASIEDLRIPPSNHLERLRGYENRWSIRINIQWRITFDWIGKDAYNVKIEDYH